MLFSIIVRRIIGIVDVSCASGACLPGFDL